MAKTVFTKENAKEYGARGGKKQAENAAKRREIRKCARDIIDMSMHSGDDDDFDCIEDAKGKNLSLGESIYIAQAIKALKGDTRAAEFCYNYANLKPKEEVEVSATIQDTGEIDNLLKILGDAKKKK